MRRPGSIPKTLAGLVAGGALLLGLGACGAGVNSEDENLIAGKRAFIEKCGSCHKLARAGTTGVAGPDLDAAFERALIDGMKRDTIEGVVYRQIEQPNRFPQLAVTDPEDNEPGALMPANIVKGKLAHDVAAYVAFATAARGDDPGRLADIGVEKSTATAKAENGTLDIPADEGGALLYQFAKATAEAGPLTINSKNDSGVPHNIALEGNGVDELGPVVQDGGVSTIKVDVEPGEYTFYCSVQGHREGGMLGTLTVE